MNQSGKLHSPFYCPFCLKFFVKIEQNGEYSAIRTKSAILFVIFLLQNFKTSNGGGGFDIYARKTPVITNEFHHPSNPTGRICFR